MDDLDRTWDDITGGITITTGSHCCFVNFLNTMYATNGVDVPFQYDGSASAAMGVPTGLTAAKYIEQFNNYLFLANVTVSGVVYPSRIYWSDYQTSAAWTATSYIDIAKNDGQQITGIKVLSDRLVVFKERSIYNVYFTGDADIPFILPGGGKANSSVGTISHWSIQEVENGLVFLAIDGFYYYDGSNSTKISTKINSTLRDYSYGRFNQAVSCVQKNKNRYLCALPGASSTTNDKVVVWDYSVNSFSIYKGINARSMCSFFVDGLEERPYFGDYLGFVYRMDTGANDYPSNVQTAIDAYYYTNWKHYDDLINQKGIPEVTIYYQNSNSILTLAYSYDFETADQYSQSFSLATSAATYGSAIYGTSVYGGVGGGVKRRDLTGRGRVVRFKFANSVIGESFQVDGFGSWAHLETNV